MSVPPRACFLTAPARRGQWAAALVAATPPRHDEAIKVLEGLFVGAGFSASNAKGCLSLATSLPFPCHSTAFPLSFTAFPLRLHCLPLRFHCHPFRLHGLSLSSHCLPLATPCLTLSFRCLRRPNTLHCPPNSHRGRGRCGPHNMEYPPKRWP